MNTRISRYPRRAFAAVMAMLYVMLFTVLAIGFYAATAIAVQIAGNDRAAFDAQAAAESGLQFVKYQLSRIEMPAASDSASDGDDIATIARLLGKQLNGSANMNGHIVAPVNDAIILPADDDFIVLDPATEAKFQAQITWHGSSLSVKAIGYGRNPEIRRAIRMTFKKNVSSASTVKLIPVPGTYEEVSP